LDAGQEDWVVYDIQTLLAGDVKTEVGTTKYFEPFAGRRYQDEEPV
jgi:hypothetical protein